MSVQRAVRRAVVAVVAASFLLPAEHAAAEFETPIALTSVTLIPSPGTVVENATVLIFEGRIVDAGANLEVPLVAERIDGSGLYVYAGFLDAQTHLGISDTKRPPEERSRTEDVVPDPRQGPPAATRFADRRGVRPQARALEQYVPNESQLLEHRGAGFTSALIAPRDGLLAWTGAVMQLSGAPIRRSVLAADLGMHGSFTTGEDGDYPESLLGIFAQFRQVFGDARRHAKLQKFEQRHPTAAEPVPVDAALDALQPLLARGQRLFFEANTDNEINRALDLAREFNMDVVIVGAKEAWKVVDRLRAERVPLVVSLKFDEEPEYGKKPAAGDGPGAGPRGGASPAESATGETDLARKAKLEEGRFEPPRLRQERRRLWEEQVSNLVRLHEAGIPFALRTRDLKAPADLFKNLRLVMDRGLPEAAAVAGLTANAASLFGLGEQVGTVRRGARADLTVLTAPLRDPGAKVAMLFILGKRIEVDQEALRKFERRRRLEESDAPPTEPAVPPAGAPASKPGPDSTASPASADGAAWEVELKADRFATTRTGGTVLIKDATVIPVTSPALARASVLVRDGKIAAIGADITAPPEVPIVDAAGRYVLPGIVDCHSHLGVDAVNESPLAISAEVRIADVIDPHDVGIYRALAGGATTHHVMHGSANPIGGQNVVVKLKYERPAAEMLIPDAPRVIKFALGENVVQANFPSQWDKRYPGSRMGVETTLRTAFEAASVYRKEWDEYNAATQAGRDLPLPRHDLRLEALADVLSGDMTVHAHCYRSDEILRLLAVAEEYGIRIGTLHHVLEGYRVIPEIARHGCGASTFAADWAYKVEAYGALPHNAAMMTVQGVSASVNSDSAATIRYLNQEAAKSVRWGGLTENQALRLVTINPAMQLQLEHRIGSLEVGKDADVAIFNGHPLNTYSKCVMTLIEGEVYFEDPRPQPVAADLRFRGVGEVDRTIPTTPHRAYAIVNATIHTMAGPVIKRGTIVIVDDKIHAVGSDAAVPPGAGVIDANGRHVYPGLIDAGGPLGLLEIDSLRSTRDNSELGLFNPHVRAASAVHPHSAHLRIARTAGITTALVKPDGARIAGQSAIIHLDGWTAPELLISDAWALHMRVPSLPVHLPEEVEPRNKLIAEHKKATKELDDFFARAKHYARVGALPPDDATADFDVDLALAAMVPYVRGEKPVVFRAEAVKSILDSIEFAEKHALRCVLAGAKEAWKVAETLARKKIPVLLGTPLSYPDSEFEPWDSVYRCAAELDRAGVAFAFASESAAEAYNLGTQAGMAVAHGLPPERGEYAVTLGAATILGLADRIGSIEVGKQADLIVVTDSPLQTSSVVTHMFIDGRPIELTSMHTETYEKFRNRPAPKLPPPAASLRGPKGLTGR
ncbi:MAG: amidohydrolase family protein [Planctomycetes bacterium]|nr:amidohydrolase family protein [Planctomycetota bacterium]